MTMQLLNNLGFLNTSSKKKSICCFIKFRIVKSTDKLN